MTTSPNNTSYPSPSEFTQIRTQQKNTLENSPLPNIPNFLLFHSLYIYLPTPIAEEFYKRFFPQYYHPDLDLYIWTETQESLDTCLFSSIESICATDFEYTTEETKTEI